MSEKTQLIILFGFFLFFLIGLIHQLIEMKCPSYIKSKGFLKLYDNEKPLAIKAPIENEYKYINSVDSMLVKESETHV